MRLSDKILSNKGMGLVGLVLLSSLVIGIGISAVLMTTGGLQKVAFREINGFNAQGANNNAIQTVKNLIQSGALVQNSTTSTWSASSTAPTSRLWSVGSSTVPNNGAFVINQCDPRLTPVTSDGSGPNLATCPTISSQVLFQQTMNDSRQQIEVSTTYMGRNYAMNALIGTAGPCVDQTQSYTAGILRDNSGNPVLDSYGNFLGSPPTIQQEVSAPILFAAKAAGITSPTYGPFFQSDDGQPQVLTYGQPSAFVRRSTGGTDWTNGNVDVTEMTAICNSLGYASYVSSTCPDYERSGHYPQGKCNFNSTGDDALSYWDPVAKIYKSFDQPDKMSVTWIGSLTCSGKYDPTCGGTTGAPTSPSGSIIGNWVSNGQYFNISQSGSQLTYTYLGSPPTIYTGTLLSPNRVTVNFDNNNISTVNSVDIGIVNSTFDMIVFTDLGRTVANRAVPANALAINFGGPTVGSYLADTDESGGSFYSNGSTVDISKVLNPAPAAVYQTGISGNFSLSIPNLMPGTLYNIRLHTSEPAYSAPNQRVFNLSVNGTQVLTNFDIYAQAGGKNIAVAPNFIGIPNSFGVLNFVFTNVVGSAYINAIDLQAQVGPIPTPPAPTGLSISSVTTTGFTLNWASAGGSTMTFGVAYAQGTTAPSCTGATNVGSVTSYQVTGLAANTAYAVSVCALNYNNVASSPLSGTQSTPVYYLAINFGGPAVGSFVADTDETGGTATSYGVMDTSKTLNPAPAAVYQTGIYGNLVVTIPGLTPNALYNFRLHLTEPYFGSANQRVFNLFANGTQVLANYDIFAAAGGSNIAVAPTFVSTANSTGKVVLTVTNLANAAYFNGLEVFVGSPSQAAPPTPTALTLSTSSTTQMNVAWTSGGGNTITFGVAYAAGTTAPSCSGAVNVGSNTSYQISGLLANTTYSVSVCAFNSSNVPSVTASATQSTLKYYLGIDAGGSALGAFVADSYVSGGSTGSTSSTINVSNAVNPAPAAIYQSYRFGNMTYTIPGLTVGATYNVRLHFADVYWTSANQRTFTVAINGTTVLTKYDIIAVTGGQNIAVTNTFSAVANSSGKIVITFTTVKDNAMVNGIEIFQ